MPSSPRPSRTRCRSRARTAIHRHTLYYAVRNHIIDFLVTRSKSVVAEIAADCFDPRNRPVVRPGIIESAGAEHPAKLAGVSRL